MPSPLTGRTTCDRSPRIDRPTVAEAPGAIGYLLKDSDPATLRAGIESAAHGGSPPNPRVARSILSAPRELRSEPSLTDREREILELLRLGLANTKIAARLGITVKSVKAHLTSLFQKIGVLDRTQAALWAERFALGRPFIEERLVKFPGEDETG